MTNKNGRRRNRVRIIDIHDSSLLRRIRCVNCSLDSNVRSVSLFLQETEESFGSIRPEFEVSLIFEVFVSPDDDVLEERVLFSIPLTMRDFNLQRFVVSDSYILKNGIIGRDNMIEILLAPKCRLEIIKGKKDVTFNLQVCNYLCCERFQKSMVKFIISSSVSYLKAVTAVKAS